MICVLMNLRRGFFVLVASMLLVNIGLFVLLLPQIRNGRSDFISFYSAGKILQSGQSARLYDLRFQYEVQREFSANVRQGGGPIPFVRPAFDAWIYFPFSYLPYLTALAAWDLLNGVWLFLIAFQLRSLIPQLRQWSAPVLVAGMLSFFPVFYTLVQGQDSILLLLLYVLCWRFLRQNRDFSAGMLLGLGVFKFPLVVPFAVPFLLRKRLKIVSGLVVTTLALIGVSAWTVSADGLRSYPAFLRTVNALSRGINVPTDMPNLRGIISLALGWSLSSISLNTIIFVVSMGTLLYVCHIVRLRAEREDDSLLALEIGLILVATLLVCYHSHVFDLTLLLLPASLAVGIFGGEHRLSPRASTLLAWSIGFCLFSPFYIFLTMQVRYPSLLIALLCLFAFALVKVIEELRRAFPVGTKSRQRVLA